MSDNKMLNSKEAAEKLGVSLRRVQQMISKGTLPASKVGRDYVILESDLESVKTYGKPGRPPKEKK
jgi:excisionase family DNA binding protein